MNNAVICAALSLIEPQNYNSDPDTFIDAMMQTYTYEKNHSEPTPKKTLKQKFEEKEKLYKLCECGSSKKFKFCCHKREKR